MATPTAGGQCYHPEEDLKWHREIVKFVAFCHCPCSGDLAKLRQVEKIPMGFAGFLAEISKLDCQIKMGTGK